MTDDEQPSLSEILRQIEITLQEPLDFTSTDPDTTQINVRVLTAAATYFNVLALREFGGRPGAVREPGLVEQVVAAAFQTLQPCCCLDSQTPSRLNGSTVRWFTV